MGDHPWDVSRPWDLAPSASVEVVSALSDHESVLGSIFATVDERSAPVSAVYARQRWACLAAHRGHRTHHLHQFTAFAQTFRATLEGSSVRHLERLPWQSGDGSTFVGPWTGMFIERTVRRCHLGTGLACRRIPCRCFPLSESLSTPRYRTPKQSTSHLVCDKPDPRGSCSVLVAHAVCFVLTPVAWVVLVRRAVSATSFSIFHLLVSASRLLVPPTPTRGCLRRPCSHACLRGWHRTNETSFRVPRLPPPDVLAPRFHGSPAKPTDKLPLIYSTLGHGVESFLDNLGCISTFQHFMPMQLQQHVSIR